MAALKGAGSAVVDFDYLVFEDGATLVVVGEESYTVRAYLVKEFTGEFITAEGKL